jgi:hypothetical protein
MTLRNRQHYAHQRQHNRHDRQPPNIARYPEFFSQLCSACSAPGVTEPLLDLDSADSVVCFTVHGRIVPVKSSECHEGTDMERAQLYGRAKS